MNYRKFGNLDWNVSALGFGCMRLPVIDGKRDCVDIPTATEMIYAGIEAGINYLDTAYAYHEGESEKLLGNILQPEHRAKIKLATKMPSWLVKEKSDLDRFFGEQLDRLKTERIDFYLLHTLNTSYWEKYLQLDIFEWIAKRKQQGDIGAIGFSFHDKFEVFKRIIDEYDGWDFCQIQYNYLDINEQAGMSGLKYAAQRGLAVIVMEPLMGGKLASPPPAVQSIFSEADSGRSAVDWALQWLWDQPEVTLVLSGMTAPNHVVENLECASRSDVGSFTKAERDVILKAQQAYFGLCPIPCTNCQYCLPCPHGVMIPKNFDIFNRAAMLDEWGYMRRHYSDMNEDEMASACQHCHECEEKCPQSIPISDWMDYVHQVLGEKRDYACEDLPPATKDR